ncbi:DUF2254 domain-containing protein [Mesorhizobium marinum]|uniref:DUF2254 domain-containing protein n=1 Tax=Mesorhizobium marinum TaxID=3228790 RepID=UPI0034679223
MTSRWRWLLGLMTRRLWFRATLISLLAVAAALLSLLVSPFLPEGISAGSGADSVDRILNILATSMLAVTTFSLSTMVSAYSAATSNVTPRATKLLIEDTTTQNTLATFVGSFLFSLVAIITLSTGAYGERGRVVLFVTTVLVVVLIVGTLLRWIDYLLRLGRVGETTEEVERVAMDAMKARRRTPNLGGVPLLPEEPMPAGARAVYPDLIGYVQHIDVGALDRFAERNEASIFVAALPGTFVHRGRPVAFFVGDSEDDIDAAIRDAFSVGDERSFDQDPRFGLCVMAEIASRALSPAVNDPGTAIDVLGRAVRVLGVWADAAETEVEFAHVHVPTLRLADLFDDIFLPIARDGAAIPEVQIRLQKSLAALAAFEGQERYRENAVGHARGALARARSAIAFAPDIERVEAAAALARD